MVVHALITGASSGLGRAMALQLAQSGVTVYAAARRKHLLDTLEGVIPLVLDVADTDAAVATIRALDAKTPLDLIIANAGASPAHDATPWAWETLNEPCHTNFCGAVATLTAVLPQMIARRRGHLVGISSLASFGPLPAAAAYTAPKAGLSAFLGCLAMDLRGSGVAVTTVRPGFIATPHVASSRHPTPQMLTVEAAARHIVARLPKRPARIDFPQPLALATRAFALLPAALRAAVLNAASPNNPSD